MDQRKTEIRYFGNLQNFKYHTFAEVMHPSFDVSKFRDNIIMLGYMGSSVGAQSKLDEDRFFTPLNPRLSGRSHPDMYGVLIHANILRMVLDDDYIVKLPVWLNIVIAFLLSLMLLPFFIKWYVQKPVWFHLYTVLTQWLLSILFVFFTVWLYTNANIKIESAAVLVSVLLLTDFVMLYDHLVKFLNRRFNWNIKSIF